MRSCPINHIRVNENAVRLTAGLSVCLLVAALLSGSHLLVAFAALDFFLRRFYKPFSPLAQAGVLLCEKMALPRRLVDAGPKQFAALLGTLAMGCALLALIAGLGVLGWSLVGMIAFFSLLEAAFGFCVACYAYGYLAPLWSRQD